MISLVITMIVMKMDGKFSKNRNQMIGRGQRTIWSGTQNRSQDCNQIESLISDNRFVSWEAFVEYVAANPGDSPHDHHWRSQFHQCRICNLEYDLITHLENSDDEVDFILEKLKVENLTYVGSGFRSTRIHKGVPH